MNRNLDALTVSDQVWESALIAKAGYYINRMRRTEVLDRFRRAGFEIETVNEEHAWPSLPTPKNRMIPPFNAMSDEELLVSGIGILARQQ
jgi:hypothetical protein